jgi:hypothetical protein
MVTGTNIDAPDANTLADLPAGCSAGPRIEEPGWG